MRFVLVKMSTRESIGSDAKIWLISCCLSLMERTTCTYWVMSLLALRELMSPTSTCTGERRNSYASERTARGHVAV